MGGIIVLIAGVLVIILLGIGFVWQDRRGVPEPANAVVYGVEDAVAYVSEALSPESRAQVRQADVRRMLEWATLYLQTPNPGPDGGPPVAGSLHCAQFVQERCWRDGHSYDGDVVAEVVTLQAAYLVALGAAAGEAGRFDADEPDVKEVG